jgi:hypothetical protein
MLLYLKGLENALIVTFKSKWNIRGVSLRSLFGFHEKVRSYQSVKMKLGVKVDMPGFH